MSVALEMFQRFLPMDSEKRLKWHENNAMKSMHIMSLDH